MSDLAVASSRPRSFVRADAEVTRPTPARSLVGTPATIARAEVNPAEQAATRRGVAGADAAMRRNLDARLPDSATPNIDRAMTQSAARANAAVGAAGGASERDQLATMNGLHGRILEAGGGSVAGYLRNREGAAQTAERALANAGPNAELNRLQRNRDFAQADLSAARMKVGILESGFGQLEDGRLSDEDKLSMTAQTHILEAQQARVEALR